MNPGTQKLISYLWSAGGFDNVSEGWAELAEMFGIGEHHPNTQKGREARANNARKIYTRWEQRRRVKSLTIDRNGEVQSTTIGPAQQEDTVDHSGAQWVKKTTNPFGPGAWTTYYNSEAYGLDDNNIAALKERLQDDKIQIEIAEGSTTGIVDVSDLHTGALLKYASETVKTKTYNVTTLKQYLQTAAGIVNAYGFKEVHLMLPGDLIETFTAFNHKDSWKHIQASGGPVVIICYEILKEFFQSIVNLKAVYMIEGNHDRITKAKEGNSRRGIVEMLAYFLGENSGVDIKYHPWLVAAEIDGIYHLCNHGDHKAFRKNDFWFRYGRQGMYNVLRTGHYHGFNILRQTHENLHYQCPAIFTGNFFSESLGFDSVPAITIMKSRAGVPSVHYEPLTTNEADFRE